MTRRQNIAAGIFFTALMVLVLIVPPLGEQRDLTPAIVLGVACLGTMAGCLLFGGLGNIDSSKEENTMSAYENINNTGVVELTEIATMDSVAPFIGVEKSELEYLYKEVSILAGNSLAKVAAGDESEKPHEKALFKLLGIIKEQLDIRNAAEMRLLEAIKAVESDEG